MLKNSNRISVPFQYRHWIAPDVRTQAFKEIAAGYAERYGLKCIYAYLNQNPKFLVDYAIVYKGKNDEGTHDIILYDIMPINADRCTPFYEYYKMVGKLDNFFQYGIEDMVIIDPAKFYEYLKVKCDVSKSKKSERYWKKEEFAKEVTDELLELSLGYNRKKPMDGVM